MKLTESLHVMTIEPIGRWRDPCRGVILCDETHAVLTRETLESLVSKTHPLYRQLNIQMLRIVKEPWVNCGKLYWLGAPDESGAYLVECREILIVR